MDTTVFLQGSFGTVIYCGSTVNAAKTKEAKKLILSLLHLWSLDVVKLRPPPGSQCSCIKQS